MRAKQIFSLMLMLLFAILLYIFGFPYYAVTLAALSVAVGAALPDVDPPLRNYWGYLKVLTLLLALLFTAIAFMASPQFCRHFDFPFCGELYPFLLLGLTALFFAFDFMRPTVPPFHGFIPLLIFTISYSFLLFEFGIFPSVVFYCTLAFFMGYFAHIVMEALNI